MKERRSVTAQLILVGLFWVFFIPQLADLVRHISPTAPDLQGTARLAAETPRQVANTHTIFSVAVEGRPEDLQDLLGQDDEIDRLESAILVYVGRLSQVEHTEAEGRQMAGLAQIANNLESISDIVTTNWFHWVNRG